MTVPGKSALTAGVQAAVRSGRDDVVDKFAAQPFVTDEMRAEIAAARVNVTPELLVIDQRPPAPGTVVPFGGDDGTVVSQRQWSIFDPRPIETCDSTGCTIKDYTDISFELNLFETGVATLIGAFESRNGTGQFGVKDFTCQVKMDRSFGTDPVRGSFAGCKGYPRTSYLSVLESSVSHRSATEPNWLNIKFESYDARFGISFGTVEYKSPNWTKEANGNQYFYVA